MPNQSLMTASIRSRIAATLCDILVCTPIIAISIFIQVYDQWSFLIGSVFEQIFYLFFYVYLVSRFGGTPGKWWMRIIIVNLDGKPISTVQALVRYQYIAILSLGFIYEQYSERLSVTPEDFEKLTWLERFSGDGMTPSTFAIRMLTVFFLLFILDHMAVLFNSERRAFHDDVAETRVVYKFPWSPSEREPDQLPFEVNS
jgi:uncharacterized RDD family membrane protein YckC